MQQQEIWQNYGFIIETRSLQNCVMHAFCN